MAKGLYGRFYVPTRSAEDWRQLLAAPDRQWKAGCSAMELAHCWEAARGIPDAVRAVLDTRPECRNAQMLLAVPEYQVALPGGGKASQNDLFVLARTDAGLMVMMVEGKAAESFGPSLGEWRATMTDGKRRRLNYLQQVLQLPTEIPDVVRYQLLHRAASALIEARRFHARTAVMLVHSFSPHGAWFDDYARFLALYDVTARHGMLHPVCEADGVRLLCGWCGQGLKASGGAGTAAQL